MARRILLLVLGCASLALAGGCAGATIASAGAFAGLAATSVSTGADVYSMGKLDSVHLATLDEEIAAVQQAARDLALTIEQQELYQPGRWRCTIADDRSSRFRVYVERRTQRLCRTRIDVGVLGSEPTARLFLTRLRMAIHGPAASTAPSSPDRTGSR